MRLLPVLIFASALVAGPALANDSVTHASAASEHSIMAAGHLVASGVETVVGVAAVPLAVVGGVSTAAGAIATAGGDALGAIGGDLLKAADSAVTQAWGPLKVDKRVVIAPDPVPMLPYNAQKPLAR